MILNVLGETLKPGNKVGLHAGREGVWHLSSLRKIFVTPLIPRYCFGCCVSAIVMPLCSQAGLGAATQGLCFPLEYFLSPVFAL